jgi:hypothetical protein
MIDATRTTLLGAALLAILTGVGNGSAVGTTPSVVADLAVFRAERATIAFQLSEPIAACVARRDTNNPSFHGCIDWHSAVHGTWALTAYTWATKDERYRPLIESILQPALLATERKKLDDNPDFEMPYGRAWLLRLVIDYRRAFATDMLDALGDDVAASLIAHYSSVAPDPTSFAYDSASWALINLYDYGVSRHNASAVDFVTAKVRSHYLTTAACPIERAEIATQEFMAVCTNWAWLVGKVLKPDEFAHWLTGFLPARLDPITEPTSVHQIGLDFSRAWGLWNIYQETRDPRFATAYLRHFEQTYSHPLLWRGEYDAVAHWVPQFGMLALIVTYYDQL